MTDRRIRKTEQALQNAFIQLVREKELSQITVKELCAAADINKSTFYLHYRDIYDLASAMKRKLLNDSYEIIAEYDVLEFSSRSSEIWERILGLLRDTHCLYIPIMTSPVLSSLSPTLNECITERLIEKAKKDHPELSPDGIKNLRISVTFIINGFLGLMQTLDFEDLPDAVFFTSVRLKQGF